jgi:hypothetical protein
MTIPTRVVSTQLASSKQPANLLMYMSKRAGDKRQPCLTPRLQLIYFNQPSMFLNLAITFSYILISRTLNLKGTFSSSNPSQGLVLGIVSNNFLKSQKQHMKLLLLLQHFSTMIISITRWFTVK